MQYMGYLRMMWSMAQGRMILLRMTGEYWKPVFNLLEGICQMFLVNAAHVKLVPSCWRS